MLRCGHSGCSMRLLRRRHMFVCLAGLVAGGCGRTELRPHAADVPYGSHKGQKFDLYKPQNTRACGLIVLIHGGAWHQGSRQDTVGLVPGLLAQSYVVANVGYRLAPDAPAPAAAEDVRYAVAAAMRRSRDLIPSAQPVGLIGFSAGAQLALLAALAPAERLRGPRCEARAVVSFWGITDVTDLAFGPNIRDFAQRWIGGGAGGKQLARDLSPVEHQPPANTALMALHSIYDPVVPFAHSERLVARWQAAGKRAELVRLEHPDHAAAPDQYDPLLRRMNSFLADAMACPEAA